MLKLMPLFKRINTPLVVKKHIKPIALFQKSKAFPFPSFLQQVSPQFSMIPDDFEDDVIESKAHNNNNTLHHTKNNNKAASNDEGGSSGSGVVAKTIFLLLLVSLSVVVALILVELRGKQKGRACY